MKLKTVLLALLAVAAGCAQSPAGDAFDPASITTSRDEGIICHNVKATGSRITSKRVCTTRAEREQMAIDVREVKDAMRNSGAQKPDTSAQSAP